MSAYDCLKYLTRTNLYWQSGTCTCKVRQQGCSFTETVNLKDKRWPDKSCLNHVIITVTCFISVCTDEVSKCTCTCTCTCMRTCVVGLVSRRDYVKFLMLSCEYRYLKARVVPQCWSRWESVSVGQANKHWVKWISMGCNLLIGSAWKNFLVWFNYSLRHERSPTVCGRDEKPRAK